MVISDPEYLTVREAAQVMRVSVSTVWRWIRSGQLPADRVGARSVRIPRHSLELVRGRVGIPEDRRRHADELMARLRAGSDAIMARRGGVRLPSSVDAIREAREERHADQ